jgi:hypothetical protein
MHSQKMIVFSMFKVAFGGQTVGRTQVFEGFKSSKAM